jgi:phage terminase small subunit
MLRNHRRERFAQFIAEGKTYTAAYELAGYKPNPANAAFLAKAPEVNSRITEINSERARMQQESTAAAVKSLAITKETLIAKAEEVRVQAMENRQLSAAIAAIKEIGVLTGLRIERRERGGPGEFAEVSTEQLVSELRDLGIEVKFH